MVAALRNVTMKSQLPGPNFRPWRRFFSRIPCRLGLFTLILAGIYGSALGQARIQLQRRLGILGAEQTETEGTTGLSLPRAPRELRRSLSRAARAIDDGRFADAVEAAKRSLRGS